MLKLCFNFRDHQIIPIYSLWQCRWPCHAELLCWKLLFEFVLRQAEVFWFWTGSPGFCYFFLIVHQSVLVRRLQTFLRSWTSLWTDGLTQPSVARFSISRHRGYGSNNWYSSCRREFVGHQCFSCRSLIFYYFLLLSLWLNREAFPSLVRGQCSMCLSYWSSTMLHLLRYRSSGEYVSSQEVWAGLSILKMKILLAKYV